MFHSMPYLDWIEGRPGAATYDLGSSDLRTARPDDAVTPPPLADREHPADPPSLEASVAAEYGVPESSVLVTAGATHANFVAAATALGLAEVEEPRVLVEKPGYGPLVHTPAGLGATVDRFRRPPEEDYRLDAARVAGALVEDTALVTVTNRHNPSGRLVTRERLADAAAAAGDAGAHLLVDEVYGPYVTATTEERGFGGVTAADLPNTVVTGSLTKFHGLGGLKIGWLVGPDSFVERARDVVTHVPAVAGPSVALARRFFAHRDALVSDSREHLRVNHRRLGAFVAERDDLSGTIHDGCSFGFVAHESVDGDALAETAWEEGVLVIPGRFFDRPEGIRLSAGRDADEVAAGLERLGAVLDGL